MRNSPVLPDRATDVDDRAFWGAVRVPAGAKKAERLREAIKLGRAGRYGEAYGALVEHHRAALEREVGEAAEGAGKRAAPSEAALRDLMAHKINVWHIQVVQFGPRIDWWPAGQASDNIHGLHRLHWLQPAIDAFARTGDARCRDFVLGIVAQYEEARDHPRWQEIRRVGYSFLEITAKWRTLRLAYLLLLKERSLPGEALAPFLRLFLRFGRSLSAMMGEYVAGYNAQAVAFTTLLHLSRMFPEFRESQGWDRKAVALVVEHARKGFFEDGGNRERVWGYGTMHVSSLSQPYEIARRYGGLGGHEREVRATLLRACRWYVKSVAPPPTYAFPTYGDAGWGTHDRMGTIESMARCLPEYAKDRFLGVDRTRGHLLKESGFAVLRNGDNERSSYVNLSFGKFAGWHSHWDLLSMNFWAFGEPLLEEVCRFGPYANPLDRTFYAPESHNLLLIDGMIYDSRLVEGQDVQWFSNEAVEYFSAYHRAYRYYVFGRDESGVSPNIEAKVRRTVLLVKDPGYVVVMDSVEDLNRPVFKSSISQYWHAPLPFRGAGPGAMVTGGEGDRPGCLLVQANTDGLHRLDTSKDFGGEEVAHLGNAFERYCLRARRWMPINHQGISGFATVLFPFRGAAPKVSARMLPAQGSDAFRADAMEVTSPAGKDVILLNPERREGLIWEGKKVKQRAAVRLGRKRGEWTVA